MSPYLVVLIWEFFPARLTTLPHRLDSNITQLLANLLTKPCVFYYLPIVSCNLVSIKIIIIIILLLLVLCSSQHLVCTQLPVVVHWYFFKMKYLQHLAWTGCPWVVPPSPKEVATGSRWDLPLCAPALETRV